MLVKIKRTSLGIFAQLNAMKYWNEEKKQFPSTLFKFSDSDITDTWKS